MPRLKANQRRIDESTLPEVEARIDQAGIIAEEFVRHGFLKIGIDHFAKPERRAGPRGDRGPAAPQFPGLYRRRQGDADRIWCLLDLPVPRWLCPEHLRRSELCSCHHRRSSGAVARLPAGCGRTATRPHHRKPDVRSSRPTLTLPRRIWNSLKNCHCCSRWSATGWCKSKAASSPRPRPAAGRARHRGSIRSAYARRCRALQQGGLTSRSA